ncbi:MAG: molybdopterin biosynthesis protein [Clostridiales Family XIII bacterium]|jgi:putative molybdopterin biosynthesis protein|nr:molybdopterin biosynthesis protein [Clostridiales Family XIII bacterium]
MAKRNLYLNNTPVDEAISTYLAALHGIIRRKPMRVRTDDALGMTTSEAVYARLNSPLSDSAAMDGIAVISARTRGASEVSPVRLELEAGDYRIVDTGDPVRPPYDAVIMAEDIIGAEGERVEIRAAAAPWQYVRPIGEDITAGEMIVPGGRKLGPFDIGVLLSGGITDVDVYANPNVAVIATGTEIINAGKSPEPGDIIDSNSSMLSGLVLEDGGRPVRYETVPDDYGRLKAAFKKAISENDMLITIAGSSAGTEDYTSSIFRELGEVIVHGVAIKPGKPVILAIIDGKPAVGIPGYPVSAYIAYANFARAALYALTGSVPPPPATARAVTTRRLVSSLKHREYVRVRLGEVDERLVATPLARGAGAAMSLARADGFLIIDQNSEGLEAGETSEVQLLRNTRDIKSTIVCIGSHDLIIDIADDLLTKNRSGISISGTHVGSLGGLIALKNGEAHIAPTHLLDPATGTYNIHILKELFAEDTPAAASPTTTTTTTNTLSAAAPAPTPLPVALIKGVGRTQGIMVQPGNPLGITSVADLVTTGARTVRYVNRQRGAGTRVLFDYKLEQLGISPDQITGYEREAATHMAVAAAIKDGGVDAGMGVLSAANAMGLEFIAVGDEEYDFAVPVKFLETDIIKAFIELIRSDAFKQRLDELSGYTYAQTGDIITI